jgi:SAM-dependent methyltransferase
MESDADKIIDLYDRRALDYVADRCDADRSEIEWLDRFAALVQPESTVLDIGCGSGMPVAKYLIEKGLAVEGVDTSPKMIALCRERFPQRSWHIADMRALSLKATFNGLLAWNSFFHLTPNDQRRMFPIFKRHASPRAVLMFTSGSSHGEALGSYHGEPLYHASLAPDEYRYLLTSIGFHVVSHTVEDPNCGGNTVWLAQTEK